MKLVTVIIAVTGAIFFSGCVSQSKYNSAIQAMESYRADSSAWATQVTTLRNSIQALEEKNAACQHHADSLLRVRQGNSVSHAVLLIQDTDLDRLTNQLKDFAKGSKIISSIKKSENKIHLELNPGTEKDGVYSATEKESLFKIASLIKSYDNLVLNAVNEWTDVITGKANIGDSAWVGSAGRGTTNQSQEKVTGENDSRDSAATASVGSQPYPGSGAVAMNTKKKGNAMKTSDENQNVAGAIISEFSRHGLNVGDHTIKGGEKGKSKSINKNKRVKLIIEERSSARG